MLIQPKVLIVDDDVDILQFIEFLINNNQDCKCHLLTATSGKEAIKIIQTHNISLIFLDYYLPDINGYELCRQIKQNPNTCHIPIHLFSAAFSAADIEQEDFLVDGVMPKPFNNEDFLRLIKENLKPV